MTPTATPQIPDQARLVQLEHDAQETIARCEKREAALALDALTDETLAEELRGAQTERAQAEADLRQAALAREELERRQSATAREAEQRKRARALEKARKLQVEIEKQAAAADESLLAAMTALKALADAQTAQEYELREAGGRALRMLPGAPMAALVCAMHQADLPRGMIELPTGAARRPQPLAQSIPQPALGEE
jgi:hypothetical protein